MSFQFLMNWFAFTLITVKVVNLIGNDFVSETRPVTHQQSKQKESPKREDSQDEDKPVLRRERTFDLDPKMSIRQV